MLRKSMFMMLLLAGLVSTAPLAHAEDTVYTITVTTEGIELPEAIEPGIATLSFDNSAQTEAPAMMLVTRLNDETSLEDFTTGLMKLMTEGDFSVFEISSVMGGTMVMPGSVYDITYVFSAGSYVMLDAAREEPAIAVFEVAGETPEDADLPTADIEVSMIDYAMVMPDEVPAGAFLWEFRNDGNEPHEFIVARVLDKDLTIADVTDIFMSDEPDARIEEAFFWAPMSAGAQAWASLELEPGLYVAVCMIPSPDGVGHIHKGMIRFITVK